MTSEALAQCMCTNPVVVRRIMAGLRKEGIVTSAKGHGGGWVLAKSLESVSLGDIYRALGSPEFFALGNRTESPGCLVEQSVNAALDGAFREAEALLIARLEHVTLAELSADFHRRFMEHRQGVTHAH